MHCLLFVFFVAISVATGTAWAQTTPVDHTELIKSLLERLEELENRVEELEGKQPPSLIASLSSPPVPGAEKLDPPALVAGLKQEPAPERPAQLGQIQAMEVEGPYPNLKIRGFSDVDFSATDQRGSFSGFNVGQFIFHVASPLSKKISYFGEVSFTALPTGFKLGVERSIIRYDYNDYFKASFGRYHTPINYWNSAFHHGLWLQTSIRRPEMIQFGNRFQPVHFVGVFAEGNIPSGGLGLGYNVGVGNGRASSISGGGVAGDSNNNRAWVANLFARPAQLYGLQVGGAVYRDKISLATGESFGEWITSAHLVWTKETPEFLAEFANVRHRESSTGRVSNSHAFYVQVGYRLPMLEKHLKPYYRFEYINTPATEPVLGVPDLVGSTLGIRWDISDYAAFKAEYRNTRRGAGEPRVNGLFLQTGFTF